MAIGVSRAGRGRAGSALRAAMSCRRTIAFVFVLLLSPTARAEVVSGRVFLDADRNGRFDRGEGLAGVPVSDGVAFTRTDANGLYRIDARLHELLPPDKEPILTVSFPSGTWPARGWFRRVPRAARPRSVDFPLRPDAQKLPFVFVHATDPHVPRAGRDKFPAFRGEIAPLAARVPFCILTGDCVDMADMRPYARAKAEWDLFAQQARDFPLPLFTIPGNHDPAGVNCLRGWDRKHPMYGYGFYWRIVGPLRWSFNYAGVHFVGIDYARKVGPKWVWGVPRSAVTWLGRDLKLRPPGSRVLLFVHYPHGVKELKDLLRERKVEHIFAGHTHTVSTGEYAGTPRTLSGSVSCPLPGFGERPGYRFVRVQADGLESFYKPTGEAVSIRLEHPPRDRRIRPGDAIRGMFCDPDGRAKKVTVTLGGVSSDVIIRRKPLFSSFTARPDLTRVKPGLRKIVVAISDGRRTWRHEQRCLVGLPKRSPNGQARPAK